MAQPKALIIEDERVSQELLSSFLKRKGFSVIVANNGAEGLFHYMQNLDVDIILLDLLMPIIDGQQFLQIIEALYDSQLISSPPKIIVETAVTNYSFLRRLLSLRSVFSVRNKPIQLSDLDTDIQRLLLNEEVKQKVSTPHN